MRNLVVTYALPYANGDIHLGHIVGYTQTDIWCRYQRMQGNQCLYICGSDTHGTPVMLKAKELGMAPADLVEQVGQKQLQDFSDFSIQFDQFHTTHSAENKELVEDIYLKLKAQGDIETKDIEQAFDEQENMFLPDRFVKGTCPKCKTEDQYGDACESCGATYDPTELINPVSVVSNTPPIRKESTHYFFKLKSYEQKLQTWMAQAQLQKPVYNKLKEWFDNGLMNWDISRDKPYFGFEIPGAPGKFFYVWLDAPVGYLASFKHYCSLKGLDFESLLSHDSTTELYHFVGKDIIYFHALFWPAVLMGANYRLPTGIFSHGFLTVNGEKMSKSRGTFITARAYLDQLSPDYLRYYFAAKLSDAIEDIDLKLEDFRQRVNSDLIGKYVNIASRSAGFIFKKFGGKLSDTLMDPALFERFASAKGDILGFYEKRQYAKAMRAIMALADEANQFIEQHQPWSLAKDEARLPEVQAICTQALNCFYQLSIYLKPVIPGTVAKAEAFLNAPDTVFAHLDQPLLDHSINKFKPLLMRVEEEAIEALQGPQRD